jgi:hypothetical protein
MTPTDIRYHNLFHFIITKPEINWRIQRSIEFVSHHHPHAQVNIYTEREFNNSDNNPSARILDKFLTAQKSESGGKTTNYDLRINQINTTN